jgi:hypothetical protein
VKTTAALDNVIGTGTGIVVCANLPIIWLFAHQAMTAYKDYIARLKSGSLEQPRAVGAAASRRRSG